jgi:FMN phosphatase YigB (HAD superfamily)
MLDTILFDLDGTLLPLDDKRFIELYMGLLGRRFQRLGYDPKTFVQAVWAGTKAMIANDGNKTNEELFQTVFSRLVDVKDGLVFDEFKRFYQEDFRHVEAAATKNPLSVQLVHRLKQKGYTLALATNPLFPKEATLQRIAWAGLNKDDFALVTTYETSRYAKPNPNYFQEVLTHLGKTPSQCLMVGNDRHEDAVSSDVGIAFYLVTDCLINDRALPLDAVTHGTLEDFARFVQLLPTIQ